MSDFVKAYPNPMNREQFEAELLTAGFPSYQFRDADFSVFNTENEAGLDAVIAAHNASILTDDQQIETANHDLAQVAKLYFAKQYLKVNADSLLDIFNAVKSVVDSKALYIQVQTRRYELMRLAHGWPAVQDTSTNVGKARYLETIQSIVAIYS